MPSAYDTANAIHWTLGHVRERGGRPAAIVMDSRTRVLLKTARPGFWAGPPERHSLFNLPVEVDENRAGWTIRVKEERRRP